MHKAAFDLATEGLLGITVHAGEAAGAESIAEALHLCHADRIGHGTRLYEDRRLQDFVRDRRILIETNITSNVQTRAVARASEHPVRGYFDRRSRGHVVHRRLAHVGVTLSDEYWRAHTELGFTREEIDQMILNGFAGAYLPWPERGRCWRRFAPSWRTSGEPRPRLTGVIGLAVILAIGVLFSRDRRAIKWSVDCLGPRPPGAVRHLRSPDPGGAERSSAGSAASITGILGIRTWAGQFVFGELGKPVGTSVIPNLGVIFAFQLLPRSFSSPLSSRSCITSASCRSSCGPSRSS